MPTIDVAPTGLSVCDFSDAGFDRKVGRYRVRRRVGYVALDKTLINAMLYAEFSNPQCLQLVESYLAI